MMSFLGSLLNPSYIISVLLVRTWMNWDLMWTVVFISFNSLHGYFLLPSLPSFLSLYKLEHSQLAEINLARCYTKFMFPGFFVPTKIFHFYDFHNKRTILIIRVDFQSVFCVLFKMKGQSIFLWVIWVQLFVFVEGKIIGLYNLYSIRAAYSIYLLKDETEWKHESFSN